MKSLFFFTTLICVIVMGSSAQDGKSSASDLPYYQIPDYPEDYSSGSIAARVVDGLGYRYYWATEGLRDEDLTYKPSKEARTTDETLDHIYGLCRTIAYTVLKKPIIRGEHKELTFEEKRKATLEFIKSAADGLRGQDAAAVEEMEIVFQRGENKSAYAFWHLLNGPIADAIWHTGQVVSFRRSSGNPLPKGVSVFTGKTRK